MQKEKAKDKKSYSSPTLDKRERLTEIVEGGGLGGATPGGGVGEQTLVDD